MTEVRRARSPFTSRSVVQAVSIAAVSAAILSACSSTTSTSSNAKDAAFAGTYSADSRDGTAPFDAITFSDGLRYSYIARDCNSASDGATGDPADDVAVPTAIDVCVHQGSYAVDANGAGVTLTDDGQSATLHLDVAVTATEPASDADDDGGTLEGTSLHFGVKPSANPPIVSGSGGLVSDVESLIARFTASGTPMTKSAGPTLVVPTSVALAKEWANVQMPYCWATNHGKENDSDCVKIHGNVCNRTGAADNASWNVYRSDCSGLTSFAWGIAAPGVNTNGFVPSLASYIAASALSPGDALLSPGHHVGIFERWIDKTHGKAMMIAEPGCKSPKPYAQEQEWDIALGTAPGSAPNATWSDGLETESFFAMRKR